MSNPLERDQQQLTKDEPIHNASLESNAGIGVQVAHSNEVARERFFKQFEAEEDQKKSADYGVMLEDAQLENEKTIDLSKPIHQAELQTNLQPEPKHSSEAERAGSGAQQSRAERRKKLKDEEQLTEKKKSQETEKATSREAMRKKEQEATKKLRVRLFPIWLRVVCILVLCFVALAGGAMIGYGIIGKGNPMDVFDVKTWTHIRDIINLKN
jgi:hypothetical protein